MTTHPSSHTNTTTSSSVATTGAPPAHATSATTTTTTAETNQATSQANIDGGVGGFSTQVEPQILSHEEGAGWERTVTQVPGEDPVHSIKLAGHIKGIPGRR
ncbi:hypothetical protein EC957_009752 [Mortierella hygrophila]|uniref:Uncharacterized protein n=1 Tax=Mortierella hygrophila TaxID=979708 RepID=A0A9P6F9X0_9FUNG|nr:hypothetical protein EC957_009752 [Mortierella hygrophila]